MSNQKPVGHWRREPFFWLVVAFPFAAVVAGFYTLWLAVHGADGLVVDDYYRQGLEINRDLSRIEKARARGLQATVSLDGEELAITLSAATPAADLPDTLKLTLAHATRAGLDRQYTLKATAPGVFRLSVPGLAAGHWYAHLEDADWRLVASFHAGTSTR